MYTFRENFHRNLPRYLIFTHYRPKGRQGLIENIHRLYLSLLWMAGHLLYLMIKTVYIQRKFSS